MYIYSRTNYKCKAILYTNDKVISPLFEFIFGLQNCSSTVPFLQEFCSYYNIIATNGTLTKSYDNYGNIRTL